jgi:hypothetical protein
MESPARNEHENAAGTFFDSFDGWAQLLKSHAPVPDPLPENSSATAVAAAPPAARPLDVEAQTWRPSRRPPMALLHVVDDGRDSGETIRLRGDALVIGGHDDLGQGGG